MSEHGAALQTYNQELVKCLEELKSKRNELNEAVQREEAEKNLLQKNIIAMQEKMANLSNKLQKRKVALERYERTINETELGFRKILESSQALLQLVQQEVNPQDGKFCFDKEEEVY